jgi:hypothetical protein
VTSTQKLPCVQYEFADTAGAQRRHGVSLRVFRIWRGSGARSSNAWPAKATKLPGTSPPNTR